MAFHLRLPPGLLAGVVAQARAEAPNECCGLLAGRLDGGVGTATRRLPLVNAAASPTRFESDFASTRAAYRAIDDEGLVLLAVYHSHPTSPPVPSRTDLEWNLSEEVVSLIVSLASEPPAARAWWLTPAGYREASWEVADLTVDPS